jgi:hypothetical protein
MRILTDACGLKMRMGPKMFMMHSDNAAPKAALSETYLTGGPGPIGSGLCMLNFAFTVF